MACSGNSFNLGDCLILQDGTEITKTYTGVNILFQNILPNIYIAAGLIIFFMILVGGFTIVTNAGDTHKVQDGTKTISTAIIGLVVVFASYWIIQIIQVTTGIEIINSTI